MADEPLAKAHQAIGAYFCAFSELERELGEALKIVLQLRGNPAADAIVALVGDFRRKASIVREAIQHARNANWTKSTDEWKAKADKTMGDILGCNNPGRVGLAHDYLEPHPDGSVSLQKPGQPKTPWTITDFARKTQKLKDLTNELRTATTDLTKLTLPDPSDWMRVILEGPPPINNRPVSRGPRASN